MYFCDCAIGLSGVLHLYPDRVVVVAGRHEVTHERHPAVAAQRSALEAWTREQSPREWSAMQNALGVALMRLGERSGDAALLHEAEAAYREALEREPGSGRAFFGLAASLDGQGKSTEARTARERAAKAWANADANLPQMQKLRTSTAAVAQQ